MRRGSTTCVSGSPKDVYKRQVHAHVVGTAVTLLVLAHRLDGAHVRVGGRHRGHAGPVSYTHLDVYKRQLAVLGLARGRDGILEFLLRQTLLERVLDSDASDEDKAAAKRCV